MASSDPKRSKNEKRRYAHADLGGTDGVVIYDTENENAWIESDKHATLTALR